MSVVHIDISKGAARALKRSNKRKLITEKILVLANDPDALAANVIKLQNQGAYRLRVQNWRVIFRIEGDILYIDEIEPRGSAYEDKS